MHTGAIGVRRGAPCCARTTALSPLPDVPVGRRPIKDRPGEGAERQEALVVGARPVDGATERYPLLPFIAMKTADGNVVPWLASQTDVLALDWMRPE